MKILAHKKYRQVSNGHHFADFEQALLVAVETELRHAQLSGCYFHFNQSLEKSAKFGVSSKLQTTP
jgi:hypothetical protein